MELRMTLRMTLRRNMDVDKINLGQYYTPFKYISLVNSWLVEVGVNQEYIIADLSCGDGRFLNLPSYSYNHRIGNDIDDNIIKQCISLNKEISWFNENSLINVSRAKYHIDNRKLVVVGNPPYNDHTSITKRNIKQAIQMDDNINTRDIGISSILSYNILKADYVAILHPLSYLIKKSNFKLLKPFMDNYQIVKHVVFPSSEFDSTSTKSPFPILCILYKRVDGNGTSFNDILNFKFKTIDDKIFSISDYDYVTDHIQKYPTKQRYSPEILFYTLRDINALYRSKTFMKERTPNSIDIDPSDLGYYCYIDCFKKYAHIPYYLGNFNIPFNREEFNNMKDCFECVSKFNHMDVFKDASKPTDEIITKVKDYFNTLFND